jgi:hypothetical protein
MEKSLVVFLVLLILAFLVPVQGQTSITIPYNGWCWTPARGATVYLSAREDALVDTIVNIYIYNKVKWDIWQSTQWDTTTTPPQHIWCADSIGHYVFSVDSIRDRGDNRQVLFTIKVNNSNKAFWFKLKQRYVAVGDTVHKPIVDTVGVTTDSTFQGSYWLGYTSTTTMANGAYAGRDITMPISVRSKVCTFNIRLEKITGDPTKYNGLNQLCKLHFKLREEPPADWITTYLSN